MLRSKQSRRIRIKVPRLVADASLDRKVHGVQIVLTDTSNINNPRVVLDTIYTIDNMRVLEQEDKFEVLLETILDVNSGLLFKYRYVIDSLTNPAQDETGYSYTPYSIPATIYGNQNGLKQEGMLVLTPYLEVKELIGTLGGDYLEITGSEFLMPLGNGKHKYTNWKVYDVQDSENIIYSRKDDDVNLKKLKLKLDNFKATKLYVIECSYMSDNNIESLTARYYYNRLRKVKDNVAISPILPFSQGQKMYYNVACNVLNATHINLYIKEKSSGGEITVAEYKNQPIDSYLALTPSGLKTGNVYSVYFTLSFEENGSTSQSSEEFIHTFTFKDSSFYADGKSAFPEKYDAMYPIQTGNFRCLSYQLKNGTFLLAKNEDNKLALFTKDGDAIRSTGIDLELPNYNAKGFPDFAVLPLDNGKVMINYTNYSSKFRRSCWALYDVNLATNEFSLVTNKEFDDEYFTCGRNASAVVVGNEVYYMPYKLMKDGVVDTKITDGMIYHIDASNLQPSGSLQDASKTITFNKEGTGVVAVDETDSRLIKFTSTNTDKCILKASARNAFKGVKELTIQFLLKVENSMKDFAPYLSGCVDDHSAGRYRFAFALNNAMNKNMKRGKIQGGGGEVNLSAPLQNNKLYLITVIYGKNDYKIYVDSNLVCTVAREGNNYLLEEVNTLTLGNEINTKRVGTFSIGDISFYNRELSLDEIKVNRGVIFDGYYDISGTSLDPRVDVLNLIADTLYLQVNEVPDHLDVVVHGKVKLANDEMTYFKAIVPKRQPISVATPLKLFKMSYNGRELVRETILETIDRKITESMSMTYRNGNLYLFGGRDNKRDFIYPEIYRVALPAKTISKVANLTNVAKYNKKEAIAVFARTDGKIILFNNSLVKGDITDCSTVLVDLDKVGTDQFITALQNDMLVDIPFESTVVLRDGSYLRLSAQDETMKHVLLYPSAPLLKYDDYEATIQTTLIVRKGQVVKVDDLTKYEKVIIEGDSPENTGKLIFVDEHKAREYDYRARIITRPTVLTSDEELSIGKENLVLIQGATYEVQS